MATPAGRPSSHARSISARSRRIGWTLEWRPETLSAWGLPQADALLRKEYARGFELPLRGLAPQRA